MSSSDNALHNNAYTSLTWFCTAARSADAQQLRLSPVNTWDALRLSWQDNQFLTTMLQIEKQQPPERSLVQDTATHTGFSIIIALRTCWNVAFDRA